MILTECYGALRFTIKRKDGVRLCSLCMLPVRSSSKTHRLVETRPVK